MLGANPIRIFLTVFLTLECLGLHANPANPNEEDTLRVLSFNILYGGDEIAFENVVDVIQKANPDIVGIQEAEGNIPKLAAALGWKYFDNRLQLLSKYPIFSDSINQWYYAFVEVSPGKVIALFNIHLPSDPYGPDLIRDGASIEEVLKNEYQLRYHELDTFETIFKGLLDRKIPIIVTGDFNSPSHRDWTTETTLARPHMRYPVDWVVSKRMEDFGFIDSYRTYYADPKRNPGLTWTPAVPPIVGHHETHDRIDFIWAHGIERVVHSTLVGEALNTDIGLAVNPFPSDHRAVSSSFLVEPVTTGALIRAFSDSTDVRLCFYGSEKPNLSIKIRLADDTLVKSKQQIKAHQRELLFNDLPAGDYRICLKSGSKEIACTDLHHNWEDSETALGLTKFEFEIGEPIPVFWENATENRFDWIAVYKDTVQTQADFYRNETNTNYLIYSYTGAKSRGSIVLNEHSKGKSWPLPAGRYRIHFLLDDGYTSVTSIPFIVNQ